MSIEVRIPTILRQHTGGAKAVTASGGSLATLIDDLDRQHPGLKGRLVTEEGTLHRFVNVYVNDEDVRFTGALQTGLSDGDEVTILPAVAGGAGAVRGPSGAGTARVAGGSGSARVAGSAGEVTEAGAVARGR